jgi:hypothetical protein
MVRPFFSSDIGNREKLSLTTPQIETVELDVDPKTGPILFTLFGYSRQVTNQMKGIPTSVYLKYADSGNTHPHFSLKTTELRINTTVAPPKVFQPPKDYKKVDTFNRVMAPQESDIHNLF